ncbi:hypothetical protein ACOME3_004311 [Neoechinorhynchus agilis]
MIENEFGIETRVLTCKLKKQNNMIGISIGGGYSVDKAAKLIKELEGPEIRITYKKLLVNVSTFLDSDMEMFIKQLKHKFVEKVDSGIADFLGITRAVIRNDPLVTKMKHLDNLYRFHDRLIPLLRKYEKGSQKLFSIHREFGNALADMGARDPQESASDAFTRLGDAHRAIEAKEEHLRKILCEVVGRMRNFVTNIFPDLEETKKRYLSAKYDFLSCCLSSGDSQGRVG